MQILAYGQVSGANVTGRLFQQQAPVDQPELYLLAVMDPAATVVAGVLLCTDLPPDHPALIGQVTAALEKLDDIADLAEQPGYSLILEHVQPVGDDRRLNIATCRALLVEQYVRLSVRGWA